MIIIIKEITHQQGITIPNMYALKNRVLKYIKQKLMELEEEIDKLTSIAGNLTHLSSVLIEK